MGPNRVTSTSSKYSNWRPKKESETLVNESLRFLINSSDQIDSDIVDAMVKSDLQPPVVTDVEVEQVDLTVYDQLLEYQEVLTV